MEMDRRALIGAVSALLLPGAAAAERLKIDNPRQRAIASVWPSLEAAPYVRVPPSRADSVATIYMFSNKGCVTCQALHRQIPDGFPGADMRYVVMPWGSDDRATLNHLYADRRAASYFAYMAGRLAVPRNARLPDRVPAMSALAKKVGDTLSTNGMGTPYFLIRLWDAPNQAAIYLAGSVSSPGIAEQLRLSR